MALATSTSYFDEGTQDEDPNWIGYLNEELATLSGVCLMDLGRITEAGDLLEKGAGTSNVSREIVRHPPFSTYAICFSGTRSNRRAIGSMVLPAIFSLSSARIVNQLQKFCEDLQRYPSTQAANDFLDRVGIQMTNMRN
jgi:hypothetical protein